jgi:uncharacterized Zn finger protein (UPF0148 family)
MMFFKLGEIFCPIHKGLFEVYHFPNTAVDLNCPQCRPTTVEVSIKIAGR